MDAENLQAAPMSNGEAEVSGAWQSLDEIRRHHDAHWIDDVIAESRIKTVFQPIVSVQDGTAHVQGYEFLSRALETDGTLIPPYKMFEAARLRDRLFALDRVCRMSAVRNAAVVQEKLVFVNFIPTAIYSPEHCLQTTLAEARATGVDPRNFVFEVVETDKVDSVEHLENILLYYRKHGFRYALDDVGQGYSTLEMVERLKPDFVKLDMHYVQGVAQDVAKQKAALDLLHTARAVGSRPLAEGIETVEDWRWLVEAGYELFQGYLFGRPEHEPQEVSLAL
ncbi:EAL domain-containing protein [Tumebacillus sp. ITR2]|uniref:EAL domain-containing protein n=2 Tax=Tumebacillus amylolyticus TaxID=2801339 RepID=A0ABS1J9Q2_9BACL|nr:EAL domain-containing protein [Tumebacillus amylolyticus]